MSTSAPATTDVQSKEAHDCAAGDRIAGRAKVVSLAGEGQTPIARRNSSVEIPGQTRRAVSTGRIGTRWPLEIARTIEEAVTGLCANEALHDIKRSHHRAR